MLVARLDAHGLVRSPRACCECAGPVPATRGRARVPRPPWVRRRRRGHVAPPAGSLASGGTGGHRGARRRATRRVAGRRDRPRAAGDPTWAVRCRGGPAEPVGARNGSGHAQLPRAGGCSPCRAPVAATRPRGPPWAPGLDSMLRRFLRDPPRNDDGRLLFWGAWQGVCPSNRRASTMDSRPS